MELDLDEIKELISSETKVGIILALQYFGTLNLKLLALVLDLKPPSVLDHIKSLENSGYIQVNPNVKARGKYYELTHKIKVIFGFEEEVDVSDMKDALRELTGRKNPLSSLTEFNRNLAIAAKNFAMYSINYFNNFDFRDISFDDLPRFNMRNYLEIKSWDQKVKLKRAFDQFNSTIEEIERENKTIMSLSSEKFFIYAFMSNLTALDPKVKKTI
ncbi:MAG: winged helix-turn-helix transcriptional regulator [Candidatus Heimdallarchaeota archaeon]|nr:winged helix-turn-helix transcriptional regulator [Candidatus Heimdallarchaeota archaeon]